MTLNDMPDMFAGTVYRALTNAEDAMSLARFYGAEDGVGHNIGEAIDQIDIALRELHDARSKLVTQNREALDAVLRAAKERAARTEPGMLDPAHPS